MESCEVYDFYDFGHGSVEIRCTKIGEHKQHRCLVILGHDSPVEHKNIFEKEDK